jgi:hypothetical protein
MELIKSIIIKNSNMKRVILTLLIAIGLFSCHNFEIEHPDYKYTSGFFPYQFPVRTLVLGDYIYDNSNDNAHKFVISVAMGGVYENTKDRVFEIEVDDNLCNNILFTTNGDQIRAMPRSYYTLSSPNQITIPAGKMNGGIEVQLADAFFSDPLAIKNTYVVPLRLKSSNDVDTVLKGSTSNPSSDVRIVTQWNIAPKNFTMFAVKYINEFHGVYFHYGSSKVKDLAGAVLKDSTYSQQYVENNPTVKLETTGRNQVSMSTLFRSKIMTGEIKMLLNFSGNNCTVTAASGSPLTITGTGVFTSGKYTWGNKKRDGIDLTYKVSNATNSYEATETLVIRDRAVIMEVYTPVLK